MVSGKPIRLLVLAVLLVLLMPGVCGAELGGRVVLELEYLGEYYLYQGLLDLPSPESISDLTLEDARFTRDTWLPGNRVELDFRKSSGFRKELQVSSVTGFNAERFFQGLSSTYKSGDFTGRWRLDAFADFREGSESFVGHGDWSAGASVLREDLWGDSWTSRMDVRFLHSRTRGDTTSFLFDYSRFDIRGRLIKALSGGRRLEAFAQVRRKGIAFGLDGSYSEFRGGVSWLPEFGRAGVELEWTGRNYGDPGGDIGRDFQEIRLMVKSRLARAWGGSIWVEAQGTLAEYDGSDDLYYDYGDVELLTVWERPAGAYSLVVGPWVRSLWDRSGGEKDFVDLRWRMEASRPVGFLGFAQVAVDAGYRNYMAADSEVIEITALSASLLRTDYWLLDVFALGSLPLSTNYSIEVLGDTSWEFHPQEEEQIKVTLLTVGFTRTF